MACAADTRSGAHGEGLGTGQSALVVLPPGVIGQGPSGGRTLTRGFSYDASYGGLLHAVERHPLGLSAADAR